MIGWKQSSDMAEERWVGEVRQFFRDFGHKMVLSKDMAL